MNYVWKNFSIITYKRKIFYGELKSTYARNFYKSSRLTSQKIEVQ